VRKKNKTRKIMKKMGKTGKILERKKTKNITRRKIWRPKFYRKWKKKKKRKSR
jgi:hypothetical protein